MNIQPEIHDNLAEQSELFEKLIETPRLCLVLNPDLTKSQLRMLRDTYYVIPIEVEGVKRRAILCGFYQRSRDEEVEAQIHDLWTEMEEEDKNASCI